MQNGEEMILGDKKMLVRQFLLDMLDILIVIFSSATSLILRFNGRVDPLYLERLKLVMLPVVVVSILLFVLFKLYRSLWKYASVPELRNIVYASICSAIANVLICELSGNRMPQSCYFIYFLLVVVLLGGSRFTYRAIRLYKLGTKEKLGLQRVMIIGAGQA